MVLSTAAAVSCGSQSVLSTMVYVEQLTITVMLDLKRHWAIPRRTFPRPLGEPDFI
jgi:hypothetical protein